MDPQLASWNDGPTKSAITDFVGRVTEEGGSDYVEPAARVAVFDNDGTLWTEKPLVIQLDSPSAASERLPRATPRCGLSSRTRRHTRAICGGSAEQ